jgi:hypothetical protein
MNYVIDHKHTDGPIEYNQCIKVLLQQGGGVMAVLKFPNWLAFPQRLRMSSLASQPRGIYHHSPLLDPDLRKVIFSFLGPRDSHVAEACKSFEASYDRRMNPLAAAIGSRSPLRDDGIRRHIFGYVGAGQWLFIGLVSRGFKERYHNVEQCEVMSITDEACDAEPICCVPTMTLLRAVVASPTRFRLAVDCGLLRGSKGRISWQLELSAGHYGDISTLQATEFATRGCLVFYGAALSGSIQKLQWLRDNSVGYFMTPLPRGISSYGEKRQH